MEKIRSSARSLHDLVICQNAIGIQLQGRLGNQLFQYAASRSLAERLGSPLIIAGYTLSRRFGLLGRLLGLREARPGSGGQQNGVLREAFGLGPTFLAGRLLELAMPYLCKSVFRRTFTPKKVWLNRTESYEAFDEAFFRQSPGVWLDGWFQSQDYFAACADRVRGWFSPDSRLERQVEQRMAEWPAPSDAIVAVHVRRGDYAGMRGGLASDGRGWMLPMSYYRRAFASVPGNATVVLFSDDPDWAEREFADRRPWVSRNGSAVIDMLSMARCRWVVAANSSFSWWAAWLNSREDKVVFAPRYHLGWRVRHWIPGGIEVPGWRYLDAED